MSDPTDNAGNEPTDKRADGSDNAPDRTPEFTKGPQPELPLADRRTKAGISRNRIGLWVIGIAFGLYLIITGIVGILTKAR
jgi:hypothetical protein